MEFVLVAVVAISISGLTLYSGFGLGTLLMPVFALFFPIEVAIAATAVVHGVNNTFKIGLLGKYADKELVVRFGLPAILAAFAGAITLGYVSQFDEIARYSLGSRIAVITPVKITIAILMFCFAVVELMPRLRELTFDRKYLFFGGILSGFFGGFSGHQGALRSAFLVKMGITTEAFVGTNAVIGFMVDVVRIAAYAVTFLLVASGSPIGGDEWPLIVTGILSAFVGVLVGKQFLHRIKMNTVQSMTGFFQLAIALALGTGII